MNGDVDLFYGQIEKSTNVISQNLSVFLKHSGRNISTLRRFTWT